MSSDLDTTRIVRSWLRQDEHESATRVLDEVLAALDATPQRPPWWPARRFADMNSFAKLAIATAAVVVVAVVGFNLLPRGPSTGGQVVTPSPAVSPSTSPSTSPSLPPEPSPIASGFPAAGAMAVGRHQFTQDGVRFTMDFADPGWVSSGVAVAPDGVHLTKGTSPDRNAGWILIWSIDGVYADPCGRVAAPPVSPSIAELASAVATLAGTELVSGPTDLSVGGRAAKHVTITIPEDIGCPSGSFNLWYDVVTCDGVAPCNRWVTALGETNQVWAIDVDGKHVWIEAETYKDATPEIEQEIQAIIDSIEFE